MHLASHEQHLDYHSSKDDPHFPQSINGSIFVRNNFIDEIYYSLAYNSEVTKSRLCGMCSQQIKPVFSAKHAKTWNVIHGFRAVMVPNEINVDIAILRTFLWGGEVLLLSKGLTRCILSSSIKVWLLFNRISQSSSRVFPNSSILVVVKLRPKEPVIRRRDPHWRSG